MIYTFYSFKGGVGRSMALANIAEIFCSRGLRVLMIDFDLEAPGLERYFDVPDTLTPTKEALHHRGVIDLILSFLELQSFAPKLPPAAASHTDSGPPFPFSVEPIANFILPIYDGPAPRGKLSLMSSGDRRDPDFAAYARKVLSFDWARFLTEKDGERFFEWFRLELVRDWDVVLVDSRTGVTELGGVCTHHLADTVVSFVATNAQNLEGSAMIGKSLSSRKLVEEGRKGRKLKQLFVPSRVEMSEEDKHDNFADQFNKELSEFFPMDLIPDQTWFTDLRLLYVPAYSYMERVAVREADRASKVDLIQAYGRLAARMATTADAGALLEYYAPPSKLISNLPLRSIYFSGREDDIKRVRTLLTNGLPVAICGLAGMGKTTLAVEYAYRYRSEYSATFFCPAGSEEEVQQGCEELLRLLSIDPSSAPPREALRRWLEANDGWLLILDDAIEPIFVRPLLPATPRGQILYTTRSQQVSAFGAQSVPLESMSAESSVSFFEKRLAAREFTPAERDAAAELSQEVGALPLALEQTAAYIVNRGTRIEDYLASYRKRRMGLLDQQTAFVPAGKEISVSGLLEPTLAEIERLPASADVLRVACFLAAAPIPTVLLVAGARELGAPISTALAYAADDPLAVDEVLDPLTKFSLIERNRETQAFTVHKLVVDLVLARVTAVYLWHRRITEAVDAAFPEPSWENAGLCAALISHANLALSRSDSDRLRLRAAKYMLMRGDYAGVEACLLDRSNRNADVKDVAAGQLLARVYFAQGRFEKAIEYLKPARALAQRLNLEPALQNALALDLAECSQSFGDSVSATALYDIAYHESMGDPGTEIRALIGKASMLISSYPNQAISLAAEAAAKARTASADLGAMAFACLAGLYIATGRVHDPSTLQSLQLSLAVGERIYGPEHPVLAGALRLQAVAFQADGRESEGRAIYQRAQALIDRATGEQSPAAIAFRREYERLVAFVAPTAGPDAPAPPPASPPAAPPLVGSSSAPAALPPPEISPPSDTEHKPTDKVADDKPSAVWSRLLGGDPSSPSSPFRSLVLRTVLVALATVSPVVWHYWKAAHLSAASAPVTSPATPPTTVAHNPGPANSAADAPPAPPTSPAEWGIITSADKILAPAAPGGPSAEWEPVRAARNGYPNGAIFHRGSHYWTVIQQPDEASADAALKDIRQDALFPTWKDASKVHIAVWCPGPTLSQSIKLADVPIAIFECPAPSPPPAAIRAHPGKSPSYPRGLIP